MSVYFSAIKRDLAILTEWWQQRIAWWELLNAARQIICIRKQQHTWYKGYSAGQTVPSIAPIRTEGNNTKCVGKKRINGSVTHGLRKEHVLRSPLSFRHFERKKINMQDIGPAPNNFLQDLLKLCRTGIYKILNFKRNRWWEQ